MRLLFPDACAGAAFLPPATGAPAAIRQQLGPVDCERGPVDPGGQGEWRSRPAHGIVTRILKFAIDNMNFDRICLPVSLRGRRRNSFGTLVGTLRRPGRGASQWYKKRGIPVDSCKFPSAAEARKAGLGWPSGRGAETMKNTNILQELAHKY